MRSFFKLLVLTLLAITFSACSGQKVFEPDYVVGSRDITLVDDKNIFMQHRQGVTFEDGSILTKKGYVKTAALPKGFAYLNETKTQLISADNGGKVFITSKDGINAKTLSLGSRVLSATVFEDALAIVNVKNEMKIFSLETEKELFTFSGSPIMAIDSRLASPRFYEGLVFFPTLDGKIQIYSQSTKKMIRTMSVSTEDQFNNIIFFNIIGKEILAATGSKIYLFGKKIHQKAMPVREIIMQDENIVVLRKDGRISVLNTKLEIVNEQKYPYAHFLGAIAKKNKLYVIEKEGYLLKINKNFKLSLVYLLDFELDLFFAGEKRFYFSDGYYKP